jgi:hypothetical protein
MFMIFLLAKLDMSSSNVGTKKEGNTDSRYKYYKHVIFIKSFKLSKVSWCRGILENLMFTEIAKTFLTSQGTWSFITIFSKLNPESF